MTSVPITEGEITFNVPEADNKECSTFYKVLGELGSGPTLIGLHGVSLPSWCTGKSNQGNFTAMIEKFADLFIIQGPGAGHEYLAPLADLWEVYGIPTVLYDQIGCGRST